jgi:arginyl-tRNA synthetase
LYLEILERVRQRFSQAVEKEFGVRVEQPALGFPPNVDLGEISITACFELAKRLRQAPRKIAETLAARLLPLEGVERVAVAGGGYLNFYLDRAALAAAVFDRCAAAPRTTAAPEAQADHKILVEHTSVNPNKAAHVGHLRNAVLGDTFVRLLRFAGNRVEVQNYIDNTGVQVADVVVGFTYLEKKSLADVQGLLADSKTRFDYHCWDLYARVTQYYEEDSAGLTWRADTLKAIEEGHGDRAQMAELISTAIVRLHLETVWRLGIQYDLLVQESEILRLDFWKYAFELLKQRGALRFEEAGKNRGCWVMNLKADKEEAGAPAAEPATGEPAPAEESSDEEVKIIVRSNGTVTYVGKDIAYHLWKFGLLGRDFGYEPFYLYPDSHQVWRTTAVESSTAGSPAFGRAYAAYAVIDTRQSYLQRVVAAAFQELGYPEQAAHLHHFAYEVVNLSLDAARSLGIEPGPEGNQRGYVEVSGRKGLGVKADDLIDAVIEKALAEVRERRMTENPVEQAAYARMIGVAALRYFLLKFTRRSTITFDLKEALAFEGETGPYLQYSVVRARNIFRKSADAQSKDPAGLAARLREEAPPQVLGRFLSGAEGRDFWELLLLAAQLEMAVEQAVAAEEPAILAKYAFRLAQAFNNFYHHHRVLAEPDEARRAFLFFLVYAVSESLSQGLNLLGIEIPERM